MSAEEGKQLQAVFLTRSTELTAAHVETEIFRIAKYGVDKKILDRINKSTVSAFKNAIKREVDTLLGLDPPKRKRPAKKQEVKKDGEVK